MKILIIIRILVLIAISLHFSNACYSRYNQRAAKPLIPIKCINNLSNITYNKISNKKTYFLSDILCLQEMDIFLYVSDPIDQMIVDNCILQTVLGLSNVYIKNSNLDFYCYSDAKIKSVIFLDTLRKVLLYFPKKCKSKSMVSLSFNKFIFDQGSIDNSIRRIVIVFEFYNMKSNKQLINVKTNYFASSK